MNHHDGTLPCPDCGATIYLWIGGYSRGDEVTPSWGPEVEEIEYSCRCREDLEECERQRYDELVNEQALERASY